MKIKYLACSPALKSCFLSIAYFHTITWLPDPFAVHNKVGKIIELPLCKKDVVQVERFEHSRVQVLN